MRTPGRLFALVAALLAATTLVGAPFAGPPLGGPAHPDTCPVGTGPTVEAAALASPASVAGCGLDDAVVTLGRLGVQVPRRDDETVTAAGSAADGHPTMLTVRRAAGRVVATIWRPDGETVPAPRAPISRLGRADGQPADGTPPPPPTRQEATSTGARCADSAGSWLGMRWSSTYRWLFRSRGAPGYLGGANPVRHAVRDAGRAVDDGRNECGLDAPLRLSQRYAGDTSRDAGIRADGTCGHRDDRNVVAFGTLNGGLLALTCLWWSRGRTVEADIRISDVPGLFTLDPGQGCTSSWDLQGTLTHEFGHVFGLGHVSYTEHGDLTMSDGLPACSSRMRTLGLGDYLALRARYGTG